MSSAAPKEKAAHSTADSEDDDWDPIRNRPKKKKTAGSELQPRVGDDAAPAVSVGAATITASFRAETVVVAASAAEPIVIEQEDDLAMVGSAATPLQPDKKDTGDTAKRSGAGATVAWPASNVQLTSVLDMRDALVTGQHTGEGKGGWDGPPWEKRGDNCMVA